MKWNLVRIAYALLTIASIVVASGAPWKWG